MTVSPRQLVLSAARCAVHRCFALAVACALGATFVASAAVAEASDRSELPRASIAAETDILSYFIGGYSGIVNVSLRNGLQFAAGTGRYDLPTFLVEGEAHYDEAKWEATATSVQVARVTYRFHGPMRNGPALGVVVLSQNWRVKSAPLAGETTFRPLNIGITGGWYQHIGEHFYVYPTVAFTRNRVTSGEPSLNGTPFDVEEWAPNASLHVGWEWSL